MVSCSNTNSDSPLYSSVSRLYSHSTPALCVWFCITLYYVCDTAYSNTCCSYFHIGMWHISLIRYHVFFFSWNKVFILGWWITSPFTSCYSSFGIHLNIELLLLTWAKSAPQGTQHRLPPLLQSKPHSSLQLSLQMPFLASMAEVIGSISAVAKKKNFSS